jgi:glycosyltransferase involved in cell wall biosynthesis
MKDLSIIIPARSEEFLKLTVEDILKNKRGNTEIIVGLDGQWANPPIDQHPDVNVIYYPESIGQRAITNRCVMLAQGKYVMKVDAHCAFDEGFDIKMTEAFKETGDNVCMVPFMRNLHVYDWKCYKCGKRTYQDTGDICPIDGEKMRKKILWKPRSGTWNSAYCFDPEPHFQYHGEQKVKQIGELVETMSLQGSCFMCTKEKYLELNLNDEEFGSWGSQGIEVACKFWLSGGRVLCNKRTWYAHCFRTKPAVFGFPYQLSGRQIEGAKKKARELFFEGKWPLATKKMSWLVEKFWPVRGWVQEDLDKLKASGN